MLSDCAFIDVRCGASSQPWWQHLCLRNEQMIQTGAQATFLKIYLYYFLFVFVCVGVCVSVTCVQVPREGRRGCWTLDPADRWFPRAGSGPLERVLSAEPLGHPPARG